MTGEDRWAAPQPVSDVLLAFPGRVSHLMPPREECEAALGEMADRGARWRRFQFEWFFRGLPSGFSVDLAPGVDGDIAFRHLHAIQGSFEPKHEHKEAAVAYLASRWFPRLSWDVEPEASDAAA
jgi:hypothetical protein